MTSSFVPDAFVPPKSFTGDQFRLEMLEPSVAEIDYRFVT